MRDESRLRLCHVGGEDVHARIPILQRLSDEFEVSALGSDGADRFAALGIPFEQYSLQRSLSPVGDFRSIRQLTGHFRRLRPDIVHAFDTKPAIYAMEAAENASVPVKVRTITGLGYLFSEENSSTRLLRPIWSRLQKRAGARASWTVFQNEDDRRLFAERSLVPLAQTSVIAGSGVDAGRLRGSMLTPKDLNELRRSLGLRDGPVVLMAARLVRQKGVHQYIAAARTLTNRFPSVNFLLAGACEGEGREAIAKEDLLRASPFLKHLGFRPDIPSLLQLADIVVLPTYYREGIPRILMEAALMHAAIVATDMPGCREVIDGGRLGWLTAPRDGAALAEAIGAALEAPEAVRLEVTRQCAEFVSANFSLEVVARKYRELYADLACRAACISKNLGG